MPSTIRFPNLKHASKKVSHHFLHKLRYGIVVRFVAMSDFGEWFNSYFYVDHPGSQNFVCASMVCWQHVFTASSCRHQLGHSRVNDGSPMGSKSGPQMGFACKFRTPPDLLRSLHALKNKKITYGPRKAVAEVSNHNEPIGRKSGSQLVWKSMDFTLYKLFCFELTNWLTN